MPVTDPIKLSTGPDLRLQWFRDMDSIEEPAEQENARDKKSLRHFLPVILNSGQ